MKLWNFLSTLLITLILTLLAFNQSVLKYIEQTYHWSILQENTFLQTIGYPAQQLSSFAESLFPNPSTLLYNEPNENIPQDIQEEHQEIPRLSLEDGKLIIQDYATFLFIGDSMMQGISMSLASKLKKQNIQVIDMAKQSTGLTYQKFFNWPEVLENTLNENSNIDAIVVVLGANDPWNIGKIKFASLEWDSIYSQRVQTILELAKARNIFVFWYEVPMVRNKQLNEKIRHLNQIYETESFLYNAFFIKTNFLFAPNDEYTPEIEKEDGKKVRIRSNDGIHFTPAGSRLLSNLLLQKIEVIHNETEEQEDNTIPQGSNNE